MVESASLLDVIAQVLTVFIQQIQATLGKNKICYLIRMTDFDELY